MFCCAHQRPRRPESHQSTAYPVPWPWPSSSRQRSWCPQGQASVSCAPLASPAWTCKVRRRRALISSSCTLPGDPQRGTTGTETISPPLERANALCTVLVKFLQRVCLSWVNLKTNKQNKNSNTSCTTLSSKFSVLLKHSQWIQTETFE